MITTLDRAIINTVLDQHHAAFIDCIRSLPKEHWGISQNGKWSHAQQLDHILRSVGPVKMAMGLPKWFLRLAFGKPNRTARSYDALVHRYQEKLAAGGRASGRFVPPSTPTRSVERMSADLRKLIDSLKRRVNNWSDKDLDTTLLPHPLLGKLTMREMLYFTIYHVQHHHGLVKRDYAENN